MKRLALIVSAVATLISTSVWAEENKETSEKSDWFGELRVSHEFSDSISVSDSTTGNDKADTIRGAELTNATSFGVERFGSPKVKATGFTTVGGTVYTTTTLPFEMTNYMFEVGLNNQISESFDFRLFGGVGLASTKSKKWSTTLSGTVANNLGRSTSKSNTSTRVGLGVGYKLSEGAKLVTVVQYSNYGEAFWKNSDNNNGITSKIKSVEAGVRLVFDL